jgi:hypothetical protein
VFIYLAVVIRACRMFSRSRLRRRTVWVAFSVFVSDRRTRTRGHRVQFAVRGEELQRDRRRTSRRPVRSLLRIPSSLRTRRVLHCRVTFGRGLSLQIT